ncbi:RNA polymerase sigma-70 factor [Ktedonosporobacter rubrisoli]|uniref:RNA polymerase sigma-70 factor n=1 Tax=Ktedonosporobacter rubrisoli TaxID=2509675 RepID=A0A4P6JJZ5_KTERU|nr:RNA polymerase sigma-70 factor [Ktedonosporobacter rubrisoli]QBD75458.1 RNA polymerase sigma-70 factor [Ktedonosporobacter rubrisoli]
MENFETYRTYLFSIAYRMLGSAMDAEDMVQETYIRYQAAAEEDIHSLKAYLSTILVRLCMDQLQLARRKREVYVGPWLPEPIHVTDMPVVDPEERVEVEESVSLAFMVLLEKLQPFERAVFLLREIFEYEFTEIASMLGKTEAACRRSFSRAKLHLREHRPRFPASPQIHQQLLSRYSQAVQTGEIEPLMDLLAENVTLWADGGGKTSRAVIRPIRGREAVARVSARSTRFWPKDYRIELSEINGQLAVILRDGNKPFSVLAIEVEEDLIRTIWIITNPEKLAHV